MKKNYIAIIPIFLALALTSCNASLFSNKTYADVIKEDLYALNKEIFDSKGIKASEIIIERSYICVEDVICFDVAIQHKYKGTMPGTGVTLKYDDIEIYFDSRYDIPYVWEKHEIKLLTAHYNSDGTLDCYSKDDFAIIKNMYENNLNDFSFLDRPYSE